MLLRSAKAILSIFFFWFLAVAANAEIGTSGIAAPTDFEAQSGPDQALGVILWSPGAGDPHPRSDTGAVPYVLDWFYADGWDVMYLNRSGTKFFEDRPRHAAQIRQAVAELRAAGYKRVIVAGQSSGGLYSLLAASEDLNAYGLLLMAPGPSSGPLPFEDALQAARAARMAVFHFLDDEILGQRDRATVAALLAQKPHSLNIHEPDGLFGHDAGYRSSFSARFGDCVLDFFDPDRMPTGRECEDR